MIFSITSVFAVCMLYTKVTLLVSVGYIYIKYKKYKWWEQKINDFDARQWNDLSVYDDL